MVRVKNIWLTLCRRPFCRCNKRSVIPFLAPNLQQKNCQAWCNAPFSGQKIIPKISLTTPTIPHMILFSSFVSLIFFILLLAATWCFRHLSTTIFQVGCLDPIKLRHQTQRSISIIQTWTIASSKNIKCEKTFRVLIFLSVKSPTYLWYSPLHLLSQF